MEKFKTLKDHVYDYLAQHIRDGSIQPGQRISENIICETLNISRTPVREALIQLAAEGILDSQTRKGFAVKSMSEETIRQIYQVLGSLDGYAAKLSCGRLASQDFLDMAFYIKAMDIAIETGNFEMYYKQQETFHNIYIDKCGNEVLIDTIAKTRNKLLKKGYSDHADEKLKEVFYDTNKEHRQIYTLLQAGKGDELQQYISVIHWKPVYASYDVIV